MTQSNGLLKVGSVALLSAVTTGIVIAAPVTLTPKQIKAAESITSNRAVISAPIVPKTSDYTGEDELPIPEGVKPIQGMNIPLNMRKIKIYGLDHKAYGVALINKAVSNAAKYHNGLKGAPKIKGGFKVIREKNAYSILVNSQIYLSFVYAFAQEITQKYQADQFLLARAIVPEQKINQKGGTVEICVAEGYLSGQPTVVFPASVKNQARLKRKLAPHLAKLKNMKPLSFKTLERSLLLLRDMPGMDIKTTFKQAVNTRQKISSGKSVSICEQALKNGAGSTLLEVRAEINQVDGEVSIDNFGTEALGPEIMKFKVGVNSRLKAGDRYELSVKSATDTGETLNYAINAQTPIGVDGLKAKLFYSTGEAKPGGFLDGNIRVSNQTEVVGVSVEYPYIRSRKKNLTFQVGLRSHKVITDSAAGTLEDSDLTTARFRATYDFSDKYNAVNLVSGELITGLSGRFVSNINRERANSLNENFVMIRGELARYQAIDVSKKASGGLTWINSLSWQYTNDPLYSSEEFVLGGRDYGRGYDLAIITGDQAIAVKTELQYTNKTKHGKYKTYGFADYGKVKNLDKSVVDGKVVKAEDQSLTSVGVGVEFETNNNWFFKLELTNPVSIKPNIDVDTRTYAQIGYRW